VRESLISPNNSAYSFIGHHRGIHWSQKTVAVYFGRTEIDSRYKNQSDDSELLKINKRKCCHLPFKTPQRTQTLRSVVIDLLATQRVILSWGPGNGISRVKPPPRPSDLYACMGPPAVHPETSHQTCIIIRLSYPISRQIPDRVLHFRVGSWRLDPSTHR